MFDVSYKNGLLFLSSKVYGDIEEDHLKAIVESVDGDFIKDHVLDAPSKYLGGSNVLGTITMNDLNFKLRRTGYSTAQNVQGMPADAFVNITEKGICSRCGALGPVIGNTATICPAESEWGKGGLCLSPPERRLHFCQKCAFLIYSGMAGTFRTFIKGANMRVMFDSSSYDSLWRASSTFADIDRGELNSLKLTIIPNGEFEAVLFAIYDFATRLTGNTTYLEQVNMYYSFSAKPCDDGGIIQGSTLHKLARFFYSTNELRETDAIKINERGEKPFPFQFFMSTSVTGDVRKPESSRLRNLFCQGLLNKKVDFPVITEIAFEKKRKGEGYPVPAFYKIVIAKYLEAFGMSEEQENFRRLNGFGYSLGKSVKGTNLEGFTWEIFRARTFEEMLETMSELQLKLGNSQNWQPLLLQKDNWKTTKAILLNGMLNAIHQGGDGGE